MGINDLWNVLDPAKKSAEVKDLRGQQVAVDLSGWIYECSLPAGVPDSKLHLRTIFWRVYHLIRNKVSAVFVLDGCPPDLKKATIEQRQAARHLSPARASRPCGFFGETSAHSASGFLSSRVRECCEMLDLLGVPYVQSSGEAEAACAKLNIDQHVDAVVTEDGDAFVFGALKVYRRFSCDPSSAGSMCCYDVEGLRTTLGLERSHLVALALLLGCDYNAGVRGIGKEHAMHLLQELKGEDPLQRMRCWRDADWIEEVEAYKTLSKPSHCSRCGHPGTSAVHARVGCAICASDVSCEEMEEGGRECSCDYHIKQEKYKSHAAEIKARRHAMQDPNFPSEAVIQEFLSPKSDVTQTDFSWRRPDFHLLQAYFKEHFHWSKDASFGRLLPLLTAWDMAKIEKGEPSLSVPKCIIKSRKVKSIPVYEVQWDTIDGVDSCESLVTTEDAEWFQQCFPGLVSSFVLEQEKQKEEKKESKSRKSKPNKREAAVSNNMRIDQMFKIRKSFAHGSVKASKDEAQGSAALNLDGCVDEDTGTSQDESEQQNCNVRVESSLVVSTGNRDEPSTIQLGDKENHCLVEDNNERRLVQEEYMIPTNTGQPDCEDKHLNNIAVDNQAKKPAVSLNQGGVSVNDSYSSEDEVALSHLIRRENEDWMATGDAEPDCEWDSSSTLGYEDEQLPEIAAGKTEVESNAWDSLLGIKVADKDLRESDVAENMTVSGNSAKQNLVEVGPGYIDSTISETSKINKTYHQRNSPPLVADKDLHGSVVTENMMVSINSAKQSIAEVGTRCIGSIIAESLEINKTYQQRNSPVQEIQVPGIVCETNEEQGDFLSSESVLLNKSDNIRAQPSGFRESDSDVDTANRYKELLSGKQVSVDLKRIDCTYELMRSPCKLGQNQASENEQSIEDAKLEIVKSVSEVVGHKNRKSVQEDWEDDWKSDDMDYETDADEWKPTHTDVDTSGSEFAVAGDESSMSENELNHLTSGKKHKNQIHSKRYKSMSATDTRTKRPKSSSLKKKRKYKKKKKQSTNACTCCCPVHNNVKNRAQRGRGRKRGRPGANRAPGKIQAAEKRYTTRAASDPARIRSYSNVWYNENYDSDGDFDSYSSSDSLPEFDLHGSSKHAQKQKSIPRRAGFPPGGSFCKDCGLMERTSQFSAPQSPAKQVHGRKAWSGNRSSADAGGLGDSDYLPELESNSEHKATRPSGSPSRHRLSHSRTFPQKGPITSATGRAFNHGHGHAIGFNHRNIRGHTRGRGRASYHGLGRSTWQEGKTNPTFTSRSKTRIYEKHNAFHCNNRSSLVPYSTLENKRNHHDNEKGFTQNRRGLHLHKQQNQSQSTVVSKEREPHSSFTRVSTHMPSGKNQNTGFHSDSSTSYERHSGIPSVTSNCTPRHGNSTHGKSTTNSNTYQMGALSPRSHEKEVVQNSQQVRSPYFGERLPNASLRQGDSWTTTHRTSSVTSELTNNPISQSGYCRRNSGYDHNQNNRPAFPDQNLVNQIIDQRPGRRNTSDCTGVVVDLTSAEVEGDTNYGSFDEQSQAEDVVHISDSEEEELHIRRNPQLLHSTSDYSHRDNDKVDLTKDDDYQQTVLDHEKVSKMQKQKLPLVVETQERQSLNSVPLAEHMTDLCDQSDIATSDTPTYQRGLAQAPRIFPPNSAITSPPRFIPNQILGPMNPATPSAQSFSKVQPAVQHRRLTFESSSDMSVSEQTVLDREKVSKMQKQKLPIVVETQERQSLTSVPLAEHMTDHCDQSDIPTSDTPAYQRGLAQAPRIFPPKSPVTSPPRFMPNQILSPMNPATPSAQSFSKVHSAVQPRRLTFESSSDVSISHAKQGKVGSDSFDAPEGKGVVKGLTQTVPKVAKRKPPENFNVHKWMSKLTSIKRKKTMKSLKKSSTKLHVSQKKTLKGMNTDAASEQSSTSDLDHNQSNIYHKGSSVSEGNFEDSMAMENNLENEWDCEEGEEMLQEQEGPHCLSPGFMNHSQANVLPSTSGSNLSQRIDYSRKDSEDYSKVSLLQSRGEHGVSLARHDQSFSQSGQGHLHQQPPHVHAEVHAMNNKYKCHGEGRLAGQNKQKTAEHPRKKIKREQTDDAEGPGEFTVQSFFQMLHDLTSN